MKGLVGPWGSVMLVFAAATGELSPSPERDPERAFQVGGAGAVLARHDSQGETQPSLARRAKMRRAGPGGSERYTGDRTARQRVLQLLLAGRGDPGAHDIEVLQVHE